MKKYKPGSRISGLEEFVKFERGAGFRPKLGCGPVATGGFSSGGVSGRIEHTTEEK